MISPNYFDYAAATPLDTEVFAVMAPYFKESFFNPSAQYLQARQVAQDIKAAREKLAACLGVRASEIIFTAGGTEANNLAIHSILKQHADTEIIVSAIEHESVIVPAAQYRHLFAPVTDAGYIDIEQLASCITPKTVLISVMYANNEIGTIQPLKVVAKLVARMRVERLKSGNSLPLYLHTDASQAGNYLPLKVHALGVDMMTINGGKIYGPKQSGALWVRSGITIVPDILGGGQELGRRSGTENVAGIIGLTEAVNVAQAKREKESERLVALQKEALTLINETVPLARVNGGMKRLANNIHVTIPGVDNERLMMALDESGYQVAVGSACSASSEKPSHVLEAIGLDEKLIRSSIRISMGRHTTQSSLRGLIKTLALLCDDLASV